ncbi:hypothetical protein MAM1_0048d03243 [Mucor ambiguus]|uniref:HIG1 domain-containing protein n=1 Tax=Mucor ambiguus TaxID=91626 RepID=A0A0C9MP62_9FUNG|nr:hypothetical protein MAM1_0048d03243 [Mucor ambiguus]
MSNFILTVALMISVSSLAAAVAAASVAMVLSIMKEAVVFDRGMWGMNGKQKLIRIQLLMSTSITKGVLLTAAAARIQHLQSI